jgi:ankyrin repeat protein
VTSLEIRVARAKPAHGRRRSWVVSLFIAPLIVAVCSIVQAGPIHDLAMRGSLDGVIEAVRARPEQIDEASESGYIALQLALLYGHAPVVEWLLANDADIHACGSNDPPLYFAAMRGNVAFIRTLLARGADVRTRGLSGRSVLHAASGYRHAAAAEVLLAAGADPNTQNERKETPLREALQRSPSPNAPSPADFVRVLLHHGAKPDIADANGQTPLHGVALNGHLDAAPLLLAGGANANARDAAGRTPLHLAIQKRQRELITVLLAHRADPNAQDADGATPLHEAVWAGAPDIADALIARGAKVNTADSRQWTPLWYAVRLKRTAAVDVLRRHGAVE